MKKYFLLILTVFAATLAQAQKVITVAKDGSGNYKTIQAAINAVADNSTTTTVIKIKKGVYKEKLTLPEAKQHVTMVGESLTETVITYGDYASKLDSAGKNIGTSRSATFFVYGDDFTAVNLTFQNSSGPVGQAVAVRVTGTRAYFQNCRFLGFQDTLYTHGDKSKQLYRDCYIEGTVDFIFGAATAWFENCSIFCKKDGGYISAASTLDTVKFGYVFYKCRITGNVPAGSIYLGRPWRPYAKTVFINCDLSDQIKPEGWQIWSNKDNLATTYYAEYGNTSANNVTINRASWAHQLTKEEANTYQAKNVLAGWYPAAVNNLWKPGF